MATAKHTREVLPQDLDDILASRPNRDGEIVPLQGYANPKNKPVLLFWILDNLVTRFLDKEFEKEHRAMFDDYP